MGLKHDLWLSRKPLTGFLAFGLAWAVYFAQMPVIKANVGASDAMYGVAFLFGSLGAIVALWLAPLFQRAFQSWAVSLAIACIAIGMLWAGATASIAGLVGAVFLVSAGSGVADMLVNARISEVEQSSGRALMNLNHGFYALAYAGAALVTGAFREAGVGPVPIFTGLFVALAVLALLSRDHPEPLPPAKAAVPTHLPSALVLLTGLVVLFAFLTEAATEGWSALHLERTLGGSAGEGALGPAVLGLMMGVGRLAGHWIGRHLRDTVFLTLACLIAAAGVALAGMAGSVPAGLLGFGIAGLGVSVVVPLAMSLIGRLVAPDRRLAAISRATAIGYAAFLFGPTLIGLIAQGFSLRVSFYVVAVMLVGVALVLVPALARQASAGEAES